MSYELEIHLAQSTKWCEYAGEIVSSGNSSAKEIWGFFGGSSQKDLLIPYFLCFHYICDLGC
jgi:hypothetical protein